MWLCPECYGEHTWEEPKGDHDGLSKEDSQLDKT